MKPLMAIALVLVLVGVGCNTSKLKQSPTGEELQMNAEALDLSAGSEIVIRGTLLGFGGKVSEELGSEKGRRVVTLKSYTAGGAAELDWTMRFRRETEESVKMRKTFLKENASIQEDAPDPPPPEYEEADIGGALATISLANAEKIYLPAYWPEENVGAVRDNSLIWLSRKQYGELIDDRSSTLKLEIFDDTISALEFVDKLKDVVSRLKREEERTSRIKNIYKLIAAPEFGKTRIKVNGETQKVRTIQASNWFGSYTILANSDNPLILKVTLNPISFGAFGLVSSAKLLDSFLGYEVVEVNL